ncbi:MAG: helicase, partial [Nitratireductor sp.]
PAVAGHDPAEKQSSDRVAPGEGQTAAAVEAVDQTSAGDGGAAQTEADAGTGEPKLVTLWRPGRTGGNRNRSGRDGAARKHRHAAGEGDGRQRFNKHAKGDQAQGGRAKSGGDGDGAGKPGRKGGGNRRGGGKDKPHFTPRRDDKRDRVDPDSPFAKLAALKEQLKK